MKTISIPQAVNTFVAQVGNLLFRRLAVGWSSASATVCGLPIRDTADYQSALPARRVNAASASTVSRFHRLFPE